MHREEVSGSPLAIHIEPGAPCLSTSMLDEALLTSAVAGQPCSILLRACNAYGAPLKTGCAALVASLHIEGKNSGSVLYAARQCSRMVCLFACEPCRSWQSDMLCSLTCFEVMPARIIYLHLAVLIGTAALQALQEDDWYLCLHTGVQHAAEIADNKDGTYSVLVKPEKAGPFALVLSLEGPLGTPAQKRSYDGMCIAHVAAVDKCSVRGGAMTELVAGQPGKLTLARADRSDTSRILIALRSLGLGPACLCKPVVAGGQHECCLAQASSLLAASCM